MNYVQHFANFSDNSTACFGKSCGQLNHPPVDARLLTSPNTYLLQAQGKPWEQYLQTTLPKRTISLNEIKENFKVFDFLLNDGTAVSAKTMDTVRGYSDPKRVTYQLNKYVDDMVNFTGDGKKGGRFITNEHISSKELYLAVPYGTPQEKMAAINKSIDYAKSQGVKIIVKEVK